MVKKLRVWKTTEERMWQLAGKTLWQGKLVQLPPGLLAKRALRKAMAA